MIWLLIIIGICLAVINISKVFKIAHNDYIKQDLFEHFWILIAVICVCITIILYVI